jgi:hypothetical protein
VLIGSACYLLASLAAGTLEPVAVTAIAPGVELRKNVELRT